MLTPIDIENKEFTKVFRGYDMYEVDEFKKSLVMDYEKLYRENAQLKEKNANLNDSIGNYKGMEETMQNAILVAQRTAEDIKQNAYERSETIIKDAERRAAEAIAKANRSIQTLERTYFNMQSEMNGFRAKMSALLSAYMQLLSELPEQGITPASQSSFSQVIEVEKQELAQTEKPAEEVKAVEPDYDSTSPFVMPSTPKKEQKQEQEPVQEAASQMTGFQTERAVNPLVEELMKKNQEKAREEAEAIKAEENFSVKKETLQKDPEEGSVTIQVENLKNFDVFNDDSL